jgi:hypothetical protein
MCQHHGDGVPCTDLRPEAGRSVDHQYLADRYPDAHAPGRAVLAGRAAAEPRDPDSPAAPPPDRIQPAARRFDAPAPGPSRRRLLTVAGLGGGALLAGGGSFPLAACSASGGASTPRATVTSFPPTSTLRLNQTVSKPGEYVYVPFDVGPGVNRVEVSLARADPSAKLGVGLFDHRGPAYGSPGFRGIYGDERSAFYVAADSASQSFLPGPIEPGRWTVIVPVFALAAPSQITVTVTLAGGPAPARPFTPGPAVGMVLDTPGWYRGDLHCHTPESSDAWHQKTALTPAAWARTCRQLGLDFAAMTDHNVVSQNLFLARDAGSDVLLMPGEEMTNWFFCHTLRDQGFRTFYARS